MQTITQHRERYYAATDEIMINHRTGMTVCPPPAHRASCIWLPTCCFTLPSLYAKSVLSVSGQGAHMDVVDWTFDHSQACAGA